MSGFTCGLRVKTRAKLSELNQWLNEHCAANSDVELEHIGDGHTPSTMAIYFTLPADRDYFRSHCDLILRRAAA